MQRLRQLLNAQHFRPSPLKALSLQHVDGSRSSTSSCTNDDVTRHHVGPDRAQQWEMCETDDDGAVHMTFDEIPVHARPPLRPLCKVRVRRTH